MIGRVIIACVLCAYCHNAWANTTSIAPFPLSILLLTLIITANIRSECSRPNRVYTRCAPSCKEANITCEDLRGERTCELSDKPCKGRCVCKESFYENGNGECVPEDYCFKCKNPNEVFACGPACDSGCSSIGKACDVLNEVCTEKCYCRKGYARDGDGNSIRYSQCPGVPTCNKDKHEEYSCHNICPPKVCDSVISLYVCPKEPDCKFQCDCKDDLLRNRNGDCVSREACFFEIERRVAEWQTSTGQANPPYN